MVSISRKIYSKLLTKIFSQVNIPFCIFIFTFAIYIHNLSPSVYGGDSGDFLTAAATHGIPHPSGYPLYTLLGILFTSLPGPFTFAWKYGLVSSLFSSFSIILTYFIVNDLTKKRYLAITTSLILAFTYPFWLYAEVVEVFAVHGFLILVLTFTTLRYMQTFNKKYFYWLAFLTGLSLTNNLSIIILFPPIILTLFFTNKKLFADFKTIFKGIFLFLIGLTPYLYIPIAASKFPYMNWGYVVNFENFVYMVLRKYYGWGLSEPQARFNFNIISYRLGSYFNYWKVYVHNLIPLFAITGIFELIKKKKYALFFLLASSFFLFGPFYVVYSGTYFKSFLSLATLERFYISAFLISFLFIPLGVSFYLDLLSNLKIRKVFAVKINKIILFIVFLIPATSFIVNFPRTNFRNVYTGDNLGKDALSNLPENSVLLLRNDSLSFNTIYYQQVYSFRKDVVIPGPHNGFDASLRTVFETEDQIREYKVINKGGVDKDTLNASIGQLMEKGSVYIDGFYSLTDSKYGKIVTVPYGILYKFEFYDNLPYPKEKYVEEVKKIINSYHLDELESNSNEEILSYSLILADVKKLYSVAFFNIANFLHEQYKEDVLAQEYLKRSIELDPVASGI